MFDLIRNAVFGAALQTARMNWAIWLPCLGITIGFHYGSRKIPYTEYLLILSIGLLAFVLIQPLAYFSKFINLFLKHKVNPMIGGWLSISMSARIVQKMAQKRSHQLCAYGNWSQLAGQMGPS